MLANLGELVAYYGLLGELRKQNGLWCQISRSMTGGVSARRRKINRIDEWWWSPCEQRLVVYLQICNIGLLGDD